MMQVFFLDFTFFEVLMICSQDENGIHTKLSCKKIIQFFFLIQIVNVKGKELKFVITPMEIAHVQRGSKVSDVTGACLIIGDSMSVSGYVHKYVFLQINVICSQKNFYMDVNY